MREPAAEEQVPTFIEPRSSLPLSPTGQPISQIAFHNTAPLLLVQTTDRTVTAFRLRTEEEVAAKRARRKKRDRVKGKSKDEIEGAAEDVAHAEEDGVEPGAVGWGERAALLCVIRGGSKIKSFSISADHDRRVQVSVAGSMRATANRRFYWPYRTTPSNRTSSHPYHPNQVSRPKRPAHTPSSYQDTETILGLLLFRQTTR